MSDIVIYEDLFALIYCRDRYKTQKMCDEPVRPEGAWDYNNFRRNKSH